MEEKNHIYPIFDRMMTRQDKEELLGQHSVMIDRGDGIRKRRKSDGDKKCSFTRSDRI